MIYTNDPSVVALARRAFPSYNGKKFKLEPCESSLDLHSFWNGGSKDWFVILAIDGGRNAEEAIFQVPENHPFYQGGKDYLSVLPPGYAVVKHSISSGKDAGITIYVHPDSLNRLAIAAPAEPLTLFEQIVLAYTASLKSSYAGIKNYRFHEANRDTGIESSEWLDAQRTLISKKLLNAAGAITNEGRNTKCLEGVVRRTELWALVEGARAANE